MTQTQQLRTGTRTVTWTSPGQLDLVGAGRASTVSAS